MNGTGILLGVVMVQVMRIGYATPPGFQNMTPQEQAFYTGMTGAILPLKILQEQAPLIILGIIMVGLVVTLIELGISYMVIEYVAKDRS